MHRLNIHHREWIRCVSLTTDLIINPAALLKPYIIIEDKIIQKIWQKKIAKLSETTWLATKLYISIKLHMETELISQKICARLISDYIFFYWYFYNLNTKFLTIH